MKGRRIKSWRPISADTLARFIKTVKATGPDAAQENQEGKVISLTNQVTVSQVTTLPKGNSEEGGVGR
jgi:hypothetical protein